MKAICNRCCRSYASSQSLWNHKQRCKGGTGLQMTFPLPSVPYWRKQTSGDQPSDYQDDPKPEEDPGKKTSDCQEESESDEPDDESEEESDDEPEDESEDESDFEYDEGKDVWLWEKAAMACKRGDEDILDWLMDMIRLYKWSQKDPIFQKLMQDFEWLKEKGYSLPMSFTFTVLKNKDSIVAATADGTGAFWEALRNKVPMPRGCQWLTGDDCHCEACFGNSLLSKVQGFVKFFYGMTKEDTIRKILDEVKGDALVNDVEESIERHKDEILEKYQKADKLIEELGIVDNPNRPRFSTEGQ